MEENVLRDLDSRIDTSILTDGERFSALIDGMADCLSQVMTLKDPSLTPAVSWNTKKRAGLTKKQYTDAKKEFWKKLDVSESRIAPFGQILHEEFLYKADERQEAKLEEMLKLHCHVKTTLAMCNSMIKECNEEFNPDDYQDESSDEDDDDKLRKNVDLWLYAYSLPHTPYFFKYEYETSRRKQILSVGAIASGLCEEMFRLTLEWLNRCDRIFCSIHGVPCEDNDEVDDFIERVARAIARRHALLRHPMEVDLKAADVPIEPRFLECRCDAEFRKHSAESYHRKIHDTNLLKDLLVLAKSGGSSHASQQVLLTRTHNIASVIENPPQELGLHIGKRAAMFNFDLLRRVLDTRATENPFMCRCQFATEWQERCGDAVAVEVEKAISNIWREDFRSGVNYLDVATTQRRRGSTELPPNPCAFEEQLWFAHLPDYTKRTCLSDIGMRIVCISTMLWNRLRADTIKYGTARKQVVHTVATENIFRSTYVGAILETERQRNNDGISLLIFERDLQNPSSEVNTDMHLPLCALSAFSYSDIKLVFNTPSVFKVIRHELSSRTRNLVSNRVVPNQYSKFTDDALTIMMCCIDHTRKSQGLHPNSKPNPVSDMLRCIPLAREWNPLSGHLKLGIDDLKYSHRDLRRVLDRHVELNTGLVWHATTRKGAKTEYVFETSALKKLMHV